jgi:hypothetical protein
MAKEEQFATAAGELAPAALARQAKLRQENALG